MANVNSISSSSSYSTSSIYGNRSTNILSGLASGLDTESMIQNSVKGYQTKIQNLLNQQTKVTWKQDAYRSITDKLIALSSRYTSYTSKTNLFSSSFFNNAVTTTATGANKDLVTATGKSSNEIQLNAVKQVATAAKYTVSADSLSTASGLTGTSIDWSQGGVEVSDMVGSLTFKVGGDVNNTTVELSFTADDLQTLNTATAGGSSKAQALADLINKKLDDLKGENKAGSDYLKAEVNGSEITFNANSGESAGVGDNAWISAAEGSIAKALGLESVGDGVSSVSMENVEFSHTVSFAESLSEKTISVTLDGTKKDITLGKYDSSLSGDALRDAVMADLNAGLSSAYGSKVTASLSADNKLTFSTTSQGSALKVDSDANASLGLGGGLTSYLNVGRTLGDLLGADMGGLTPSGTDENGNDTYDFVLNGKSVGQFTKDTALESVMNAINNGDFGVSVGYSIYTNAFTFTGKSTGSESRVEFDDGLSGKLFKGSDYDTSTTRQGQDAVFNVTINGESMTMTRSSNKVELEGLTFNLKGAFNQDAITQNADGSYSQLDSSKVAADSAVGFESKPNSDTIVDAVKKFVEEVNAILKETHDAYSTAPLKSSGNNGYDPLSDEDKQGMSESQINAYEEKAKTGLLYGDRDLNQLYNALRSAVTGSGLDTGILRDIGLTTSYADGLTTLNLDEDKLRSALEADPNQVRDAFTKTVDSGFSTDGLMAKIKSVTDKYASTSIGSYGTLVKKAGTKTKSLTLLDNEMQKLYDNYQKQIETWQTKMSDKIDYYTNQFTQLEKLMNQMNSQSSALSGLMGY